MPLTEQERFQRCVRLVLAHEGGYVDHPLDPGGATNLGVTLGVAREAGLDKDRDGDVDKADVKALTPADAAKVYRERYWLAAACDKLPAGVDYIVFDTAVNMGVSRAARYVQTAVSVRPDGVIGPMTLRAVAKMNPRVLVGLIFVQRRAFYTSSQNFPAFGKGWIKRLNAVSAQAELWAAA